MSRPIPTSEFRDRATFDGDLTSPLPNDAFSPVEQAVLDIARREVAALKRRERPAFRVIDAILGRNDPLPMGSEKLEALRQYAMRLYRFGIDGVPGASTTALIAAGYTADQIAILRTFFARSAHCPTQFGAKVPNS